MAFILIVSIKNSSLPTTVTSGKVILYCRCLLSYTNITIFIYCTALVLGRPCRSARGGLRRWADWWNGTLTGAWRLYDKSRVRCWVSPWLNTLHRSSATSQVLSIPSSTSSLVFSQVSLMVNCAVFYSLPLCLYCNIRQLY